MPRGARGGASMSGERCRSNSPGTRAMPPQRQCARALCTRANTTLECVSQEEGRRGPEPAAARREARVRAPTGRTVRCTVVDGIPAPKSHGCWRPSQRKSARASVAGPPPVLRRPALRAGTARAARRRALARAQAQQVGMPSVESRRSLRPHEKIGGHARAQILTGTGVGRDRCTQRASGQKIADFGADKRQTSSE